MLKRILLALAVTLLIAGCSSGGAAAPDARPSAPATTLGPTPTESTNETPDCPNPHGGTCLGPLKSGEYRTSTFEPRLTYTVPPGWTNFEDLPGNFWLFLEGDSQEGAVGGSYLGIYQNVRAAAINCDEARQEGVGQSPEDLVAWYQSVRGLSVSEPKPVTVGGLDGLQIDLDLVSDAKMCTYGPNSGIPLIIGDGVSRLHHVLLKELDVRLIILEWQDGNVTLEITNVKEQHGDSEYRAALQPIVESLVFEG